MAQENKQEPMALTAHTSFSDGSFYIDRISDGEKDLDFSMRTPYKAIRGMRIDKIHRVQYLIMKKGVVFGIALGDDLPREIAYIMESSLSEIKEFRFIAVDHDVVYAVDVHKKTSIPGNHIIVGNIALVFREEDALRVKAEQGSYMIIHDINGTTTYVL
jgi:hypothetical protein